MMQIFVDMDGVLADFDTHYKNVFGVEVKKELDNADWDLVRQEKGFYEHIPPMPDLWKLWEVLERYDPIILTGVPRSVPEASGNKKAWVEKHLGDEVPVICCRSAEKYTHGNPGDLLIDDWTKYRDRWIKMGGLWITHVSAHATILELEEMLA